MKSKQPKNEYNKEKLFLTTGYALSFYNHNYFNALAENSSKSIQYVASKHLRPVIFFETIRYDF